MDKSDIKALWVIPALGAVLVGTIFLFKKLSKIEVNDDGVSFVEKK
jgi:hypothetical protein